MTKPSTEHPEKIQSPLARARAVGSAHDGVTEWWRERASAVVAMPLLLWFAWSMAAMRSVNYEAMTSWLAQPLNAVLMIVMIASSFLHGAMGIQVILDDYVNHGGVKALSVIALKLFFFTAAVACIFSILKVALMARI